MRENTRENESLSTEETDLMRRSSKKVKHRDNCDFSSAMEKDNLTHVSPTLEAPPHESSFRQDGMSYKNVTGGHGCPQGEFDIDESFFQDEISDDEIEVEGEGEDPNCPTIKLSRAEKMRLRSPWMNALIVNFSTKG